MRASVLSAVLLAAAPSVAHAESEVAEILAHASGVAGGLTADQVAAAAATTSPQLAARRAEVGAADAAVDQARDAYIPHVALKASFVRLSDFPAQSLGDLVVSANGTAGPVTASTPLIATPFAFPVLVNATAFSAQLDIPISDDLLRVTRVVAAAHHAADAARYTQDAEARTQAADARIVYYAWARARLSALVAADAVHQAELHLADVQQRVAAERANQADLMSVQAQRAAAEQVRVRAVDLASVYETQVRIVLRDAAPAPGVDLAIGEDLSGDLPLAEPGRDAALLAEAIAHRPELRAAGANIDALAAQARAADAAALPRLDVIGDVTDANPNQRYIPPEDAFHTTWSIGAQLTWTITDAPGQLAQARQIRAHRDAATAQQAALVDALHAEVAQAAAAVRDAASAQVTAQQQLASAEESYRVRRALFREGEATSTELTDNETALTRARLDAIAARLDARIATVRLRHALGEDPQPAHP